MIERALREPLTGRLLVTAAGMARGHTHPGNSHLTPTRATVILCVSGTGHLTIRDTTYRVAAGQRVFLPAGVAHSYRADRTDPWTIWIANFDGTDVAQFADEILGDDGNVVAPVRDMYSAVVLMRQAAAALERISDRASLYNAAGAAWRLLTQLAGDTLRGPVATWERMEIVQNYLRDNLDSQATVTELASMVHLSTSHFAASFKASTGVAVREYTRRLRLERARELLEATDLSVSEIARTVGYNDALYFSRHFRASHGVPPSDYRRRVSAGTALAS